MNLGPTPTEGRVIIVTGASAGIGRATAERLARGGATVVGCARDLERLKEVAAKNPGIEPRRCDVTSAQDRAALIDGVLARHGRIDALVNNAGIGWEGLVHEMESGDIEKLVNTNVTALIDLTRLVLPGMLERGAGHIVMTSSAAGWFAFPPLTVYSATKFAVEGFVEGLRREVWRKGVVVSTVNPGPSRPSGWPARRATSRPKGIRRCGSSQGSRRNGSPPRSSGRSAGPTGVPPGCRG